jgi:VWFA-related protein
MPKSSHRFARAGLWVAAILAAAWCAPGVAGWSFHLSPQGVPAAPLQPVRPSFIIDAIAIDRQGNLADDLRAADFDVMVDGQRRPLMLGRLYRGPGATLQAAGRQGLAPGEADALAEPSRIVLLVIDQASFLPGDERRIRLVADNCLGLLGLSDRVALFMLPNADDTVTLSTDRDALRRSLARVRALRATEAITDSNPETRDPRGETLDEMVRAMPERREETLSPDATKAHATATIAALRELLERLRAIPGTKTVLLVSAGLVVDDAARQMGEAALAAASSHTRIYSIQVPTPAPRFAEVGRAGLLALAQETGGTLVTLAEKSGQALQRMAAQMSFSYLLMLAPTRDDADGRPRRVRVTSRRKNVVIHASPHLVAGSLPVEPLAAPMARDAAPAAAAPPSASGRPAVRRDPALDGVLARAVEYIANYSRELSAVVAEEVYEQRVRAGTSPGEPQSRRLVSDFLIVKDPGSPGWLPFRDVFEVDGVAVRDREDRLRKLFLEAPATAIETANTIWQESARYNIGRIRRDTNVPTLALSFLEPRSMERFTFRKRGEDVQDGIRAWTIEYREHVRPTIIRTTDGKDVPSSGELWIDPVNGRVLRTVLKASTATITVTYRQRDEIPGLWLPVMMQESYAYGGGSILGLATYSKFRRFQVITDEKIKIPKGSSRP